MPNLVVFSLVPAQFVYKIHGYGGEQFSMLRSMRPLGRKLTQMGVRFGTAALGLNNLFQNPLLRRNSNCEFCSFVSALMRPWRCDCSIRN